MAPPKWEPTYKWLQTQVNINLPFLKGIPFLRKSHLQPIPSCWQSLRPSSPNATLSSCDSKTHSSFDPLMARPKKKTLLTHFRTETLTCLRVKKLLCNFQMCFSLGRVKTNLPISTLVPSKPVVNLMALNRKDLLILVGTYFINNSRVGYYLMVGLTSRVSI